MEIFPQEQIKKAEEILRDNGIDEDETSTVLQAIGYALLNVELYPEGIQKGLRFMPTYEYFVTGAATFSVEADSFEEAEEIMEKEFYKGLFDCGDFDSVEYDFEEAYNDDDDDE